MNRRARPRFPRRFAAGIAAALLFCLACRAAGGRAPNLRDDAARPPASTNAVDLREQIQARLAAAQAELNRVATTDLATTNLPPGATPAEAIEHRASLQRMVRNYQLHLEDLASLAAVQQRQSDLDQAIASWTGFAEPPPYSVLLVDELRDSLQSQQAREEAAKATLQIVREVLAHSQTLMEESDEAIRRLNDKLESAKNPAEMARLGWQRELEQLRSRAAAATAASFETKRQVAEAEIAESDKRARFLQRQLAVAGQNVRFSQEDLNRVLESLAREQRGLEREIATAEADLAERRRALAEAREQLEAALATPANSKAEAASLRRLREVVDVRSLQEQTGFRRLTMLRQLLEGVGAEEQIWQLRFSIFGTHDLAELQRAERRLAWFSGLIEAARPYYRQQLELAAKQITEQQNRLQNPSDPELDPALTRERLATYREREALMLQASEALERRERAVLRWRESLAADRKSLPFSGRVRDLFTSASTFAGKLWNFELFAVEDTITVDGQKITGRRGVTVGKIAMAVLILVVGYWLSQVVARLLERLAVRRLHVERNQASLIRRWVRVVLVLGLIVFSLVSVKIPLTIFAFAGGALAIGLGFGTQNLLKNFISGIIILFERPFRVGDVVDVGGHRGTVTAIGIRSSVIQLWDNTETLIPNSALLENNLTNWTYSNRTVRFTIAIGVAYGSGTRRVAQLLAEAAERHGLVQTEPKPQVLFTDFGESALNFELRYWVDVLKHNAAQIASDLRHMIAGSFAEAGIVVAFPQRDVHLETIRPLQVEVVSPAPTAGQPASPDPAGPVADPSSSPPAP